MPYEDAKSSIHVRPAIMLDWHPRTERPATKNVEILLAFQCFGSPHHPTKPGELLRWEYAVIDVDLFDDKNELELGWPPTEATNWAYIPSPEI